MVGWVMGWVLVFGGVVVDEWERRVIVVFGYCLYIGVLVNIVVVV